MTLEQTLAEIDARVREIHAYIADQAETLLGAQNMESYNKEPPDVQATLQTEIATYQTVIAHAQTGVDVVMALKEAWYVMLADGYPNAPTFDTVAVVIANLTADIERQKKALARLHALPIATNISLTFSEPEAKS